MADEQDTPGMLFDTDKIAAAARRAVEPILKRQTQAAAELAERIRAHVFRNNPAEAAAWAEEERKREAFKNLFDRMPSRDEPAHVWLAWNEQVKKEIGWKFTSTQLSELSGNTAGSLRTRAWELDLGLNTGDKQEG